MFFTFLFACFLFAKPAVAGTGLKSDSTQTVYIPCNMEECMTELDRILSNEQKELIREDDFAFTYFTLTFWIRNNWLYIYPSPSRLYLYIRNEKCGDFGEPEGMSGRIRGYYKEHLKGNDDGWKFFDSPEFSIEAESPVYVVDGVVLRKGRSIPAPGDIASLDILKPGDTTQAFFKKYGQKGVKNGVILITTKKAKQKAEKKALKTKK